MTETVGRPMEILLVEDVLSSARLTIGALNKSLIQHRLTWIKDGDEAIEFLRREGKYQQAPRPDLILLDLGLPGTNGEQILEDVRADNVLERIAVVILTSSTAEESGLDPASETVQGYLTKPIDVDAFLALVEDLRAFWKADMILPES